MRHKDGTEAQAEPKADIERMARNGLEWLGRGNLEEAQRHLSRAALMIKYRRIRLVKERLRDTPEAREIIDRINQIEEP